MMEEKEEVGDEEEEEVDEVGEWTKGRGKEWE